MSCFKILSTNYADPNEYANLLYSSQQSAFPATNLMARIRRSKVWRSNGYWEVTASNNVLVFRDASGGADKTATLTVGNYTTAALLTEIDTQMESVGAANYTVTQNSNYKFVFTSDLSGGATHFELRMADAANTCESLLGFESTNLSGASTYTADYLRINTSEYITFDLGLATDICDFYMTGFRNSVMKLSDSGTFTLQGNYTNNWTSPAYSQALTYDDEIMYLSDSDGLHTVPLRYWRILFSDQNPYGYVELGAIGLGVAFEVSRGGVQFPLQTSLDDRSRVVTSEGGQTYSEILEKTSKINTQWKLITKEDLESILDIFQTYGVSHPFFINGDPDAVYSSAANRMIKYVKFATEPTYTLESPNNYTINIQFAEQL